MFFDQAEFDRQVNQYLDLGFTLAEAEGLARCNETIAIEEYERWLRERDDEMEFAE